MATIGYGKLVPRMVFANVLVTVEALVGLFGVAMVTGLMFAKFSRPTARVLFSRQAVVAPHDGVPSFMFRMANARGNNIVHAQVQVVLAREETTLEGDRMRRFHDLVLLRPRSTLFSFSWTAIHPITEVSPFHGATPAALVAAEAEIVVSLMGYAGAVAENRQIIVTAKHCVKGQTLRVRLSTGSERTAWVVAVNDASDQAILFLEEPADVEPLAIVRRRQIPGTVLYFEGNPERPRFQSARLDRVGRCPSLPDLPNALFTSIDGRPGDSGAPLLNGAAEIVGLVHGGARCHIATPADPLARLVDHVLGRGVVETTRGAPARAKVA